MKEKNAINLSGINKNRHLIALTTTKKIVLKIKMLPFSIQKLNICKYS